MKAYIKVSNSRFGSIGITVTMLAVLLSGFFWLGYWVSETNLASSPKAETPQIIQIPLPDVGITTEGTPTPTQLLKMDPEEKVRL